MLFSLTRRFARPLGALALVQAKLGFAETGARHLPRAPLTPEPFGLRCASGARLGIFECFPSFSRVSDGGLGFEAFEDGGVGVLGGGVALGFGADGPGEHGKLFHAAHAVGRHRGEGAHVVGDERR